MINPIFPLVLVAKKEYLEKLQKGNFYMKNCLCYQSIGSYDKQRGDKYDGAIKCGHDGYGIPDSIKNTVNNPRLMELDTYIKCFFHYKKSNMSTPSDACIHFTISRESQKALYELNQKYALIIFDVRKFISRFSSVCERENLEYFYGDVDYISTDEYERYEQRIKDAVIQKSLPIELKKPAFLKQKDYENQQEFRFCVKYNQEIKDGSTIDEAFSIDIQNIEDISMITELDDICKFPVVFRKRDKMWFVVDSKKRGGCANKKNSGIEWIGEIPADWNIARIGTQYTERKTKVSDTEYPPLSVTMKGIVPQLATAAKTDAHDDRKLVCKGDFAINSRSDRRGSCGISAYDGSVSLINTILCPREEMNPEYYDWLFHSTMFSDEFYKWGHGIVDDLWTTNWQDMKKIFIPEPSLDEQEKIAKHLNRVCAEIDAVIEKTKMTIEEYKKLKQSIITEAVTKGIRGERPMKDSGIEWIGEIPVEWKKIRLKHIASSFTKGNGITKEDIVEDGDTPCVRYGEIYSKYNQSFFECITKTKLSIISSPKYFTYGDILFTCTGELVEEIGKSIVYLGEGECLAGGDIIVLKQTQHPSFLNYALNSHYAQAQKSCDKTKLKVVHISASDIGNILVVLPPLTEQKNIADYLDKKCAEIDTIIAKKSSLLEEMESYKKSIIYEYVTGKKEV